MRRRGSRGLVIVVTGALVLLWAGSVGAVDSAEKCEIAKLKEVAKYGACRFKAQCRSVKVGGAADFTKCDAKYASKWQKVEGVAGGMCPSNGDQAVIQNAVIGHTTDLATLLAGGTLQGCAADLAECQAAAQAQRLKTGQTTCWNVAGAVIPCGGTGQDGELQTGMVRQYIDNGNGTVTDTRTGLIWEKKSNDGGIHDKLTAYTWTNAFSFIQSLNAASFAGYNDWRLPNINELQSIANYSTANPAVSPAFNTGCGPGCTVTHCSCTASSGYWASASLAPSPDCAWITYFDIGYVSYDFKTTAWYVRAVRGGA